MKFEFHFSVATTSKVRAAVDINAGNERVQRLCDPKLYAVGVVQKL
jgi:hypothetical protein